MTQQSDVIGWLLGDPDRAALLMRAPQRYARLVAHHVTLKSGAAPGECAPALKNAEAVGEADDGEGVQALVVRLDGSTRRPDGGVYHITWSLAEGRKAVESNEVIAARGWRPLEPVPIELVAARFPRT
jgi:ribosomal protein L14